MNTIDLTSIHVWENSSGMMFMSWIEQKDSIIHPEEPGNLEFMANYLGATVEHLRTLVKAYKAEEEQKEIKYKKEFQGRQK